MMTTPTNDIGSARALETMIDNYRGQIGLQEETIRQYKKMLSSQEYTIGQNTLKLQEQDEFNVNRTEINSSLIKDIEKLESEKTSLTLNVEQLKNSLANLRDTAVTESIILEQHKEDLRKQSDNIDNRGNAVTIREMAVEEKEKTIKVKHEAIKNLASKL